jgi:hypothetical protein
LVFEKNANFFAENWRKSQKIVIITSTPGQKNFERATFRFQLSKEAELSSPIGLRNSISMLETRKSELLSRLETLRAEADLLARESSEIGAKRSTISGRISELVIEKESREASLAQEEKDLLEKLQVGLDQGCQMVCFLTKNQIWLNFGLSCNGRCWYVYFMDTWSILLSFVTFYGRLV